MTGPLWLATDYEAGHAEGFRAGWAARGQHAAEAWTFVPDPLIAAAKLTHEQRAQARAAEMAWRTDDERTAWLTAATERNAAHDATCLARGQLPDDARALRQNVAARLAHLHGEPVAA